MRVIATVSIDGEKETRIEGDSPFMSGELTWRRGADP